MWYTMLPARWRHRLLQLVMACLLAASLLNLRSRLLPTEANVDPFPKCRAAKPRFVIKVLAWKRRASLRRLLNGLTGAQYHGFPVDLEFWLDAGYAPEVLAVAQEMAWPHGHKRIEVMEKPVGIAFLIPRAWNAPADDEYAFFFEDDIAVSHGYFEYCLTLMEAYWFGHSDVEGDALIGISLTMPRINEIENPLTLFTPASKFPHTRLLRFQLASSWGGLYFPQGWRQFMAFFNWKHAQVPDPEKQQTIREVMSEYWPRSWKRFMIEWMAITGTYLLYPNFPQEASYSVHCREPGEHTGSKGRYQDTLLDGIGGKYDPRMTVPLIGGSLLLEQMKAAMPSELGEIPLLSLYHKPVDSVYHLRQIGLWPREYNRHWNYTDPLDDSGCILDWTLPIPNSMEDDDSSRVVAYRPVLSPLHQLAALHNALIMGQVLDRPVVIEQEVWIPSLLRHVPLASFLDCSGLPQTTMGNKFALAKYNRTIQLRTTPRSRQSSLDAPKEMSTLSNNSLLPAKAYDSADLWRLFGSCSGPLAFRQLGGVLFQLEDDPWLEPVTTPNPRLAGMISSIVANLTAMSEFICVGYAPKGEEGGREPCWKEHAMNKREEAIDQWNCKAKLDQVIERAISYASLLKTKPKVLLLGSAEKESDRYLGPKFIRSHLPADDLLMQSDEMVQFMTVQVCRKAAFVTTSRVHHASLFLHRLRGLDGKPVRLIDGEDDYEFGERI